jgi:oxygen-independent coproporphyrinogen-3 oxidase
MYVPKPLLRAYDKPVPRYTSYPTSPHFGPVDDTTYREWLGGLSRYEPISLYVHLPFCKHLCHYCGCHMKVVHDPVVRSRYVDTVCQELAMLNAALNGRRVVGQLAFGGGTPSYTPLPAFHKLMGAIQAHFDIAKTAEISMEIDPRTLTAEFAAALGEHGFTRASLGVQSLNKETQVAIHREQPYEQVEQAVDWLRFAGIDSISLDLMYGLPYQTITNMDKTVDLVCTLKPERIAMFGYAHLPSLKKHQALVEPHGLPDVELRQDLFNSAAERLLQNGYVAIGMDHFAVPTDPMAIAVREGTLRRNFQGYTVDPYDTLIGVGVSAIGNLPAGYVQNELEIRPYTADIEAGRFPVRKGLALTVDDKARREIIHTLMSLGKVDLAQVAGHWGVRVESFKDALPKLESLEKDGLCTLRDTNLELTRVGWGLVRVVAACFDSYLGKTSPGSTRVAIHSKI